MKRLAPAFLAPAVLLTAAMAQEMGNGTNLQVLPQIPAPVQNNLWIVVMAGDRVNSTVGPLSGDFTDCKRKAESESRLWNQQGSGGVDKKFLDQNNLTNYRFECRSSPNPPSVGSKE